MAATRVSRLERHAHDLAACRSIFLGNHEAQLEGHVGLLLAPALAEVEFVDTCSDHDASLFFPVPPQCSNDMGHWRYTMIATNKNSVTVEIRSGGKWGTAGCNRCTP